MYPLYVLTKIQAEPYGVRHASPKTDWDGPSSSSVKKENAVGNRETKRKSLSHRSTRSDENFFIYNFNNVENAC